MSEAQSTGNWTPVVRMIGSTFSSDEALSRAFLQVRVWCSPSCLCVCCFACTCAFRERVQARRRCSFDRLWVLLHAHRTQDFDSAAFGGLDLVAVRQTYQTLSAHENLESPLANATHLLLLNVERSAPTRTAPAQLRVLLLLLMVRRWLVRGGSRVCGRQSSLTVRRTYRGICR